MMRANFHRIEGWAECDGARVQMTARSREVAFSLCRALVGMGKPDGSLEFHDERGMHCYTIPSIHRGALLTISEGEAYAPKIQKWVPFEGRHIFGDAS